MTLATLRSKDGTVLVPELAKFFAV